MSRHHGVFSSRQQIENKAELHHKVSRKQSPHISCRIDANVSLCLNHSMVSNFYDVLLVDQNATLDEIKVAFKRRALQVHPDKGGSKEEFHMVYQALETLTDPTTRKKYDHSLTTGRFPAHRDTAKGRPKRPRQAERPKRTPGLKRPKVGEKSSNASDTFQMKQTKFLMQIRDLLKTMPRDMRKVAIRKDFTQSQRLILEKWMVDGAQTSLEAKIEPVVPESEKTMPVDIARPAIEQTTSGKCQQDRKDTISTALALSSTSMSLASPHMSGKKSARMKKNIGNRKNIHGYAKKMGVCGFLRNDGAGYKAEIEFDGVHIDMWTKRSDLPTALEYLLILISVKQKMLDSNQHSRGMLFEKRLKEALLSSVSEQGKTLTGVILGFRVYQRAGFFIDFQLRSPKVRSVEDLGRIRRLLDPFRIFNKSELQGAKIYWRYSPSDLDDVWQRLRTSILTAFEIAGVDSTRFEHKLLARHEARAASRAQALRLWERQRMALHDKGRPERSRWPPQGKDNYSALKKLLVRWKVLLRRAQLVADKARRRRQREQRKKQQERIRELQRQQKKEG